MRRVLKNDQLEKEFQENGYVAIDFLTSEEVQYLKDKFFELLPSSGGNITSEDSGIDQEITYDFTFIDKNIDFKREVFDIITKKFEPHVNNWLSNYQPIIANYIRKKSDGGEVPLHQNWAFVDEEKCTSVSIWCPLVDSNEENGTLQVVPKSHKRFGKNRGPMVPWELENIKTDIIENDLVPCNRKAGQAIILDDSIVHYSAINKTEGLRLAIQLILIPKEEKSIHYHLDHQKNNKEIQVLEVDKEFYMEFNPWKKPEGIKSIAKIQFNETPIDREKYLKRFKQAKFDEKKGLFSKLKNIFS